MKREQISETIKNNLKSKYETMSINKSCLGNYNTLKAINDLKR